MSKREEAILKVNKIILENFDKIDPNDLISAEDDTLLSDLGLDSIDACELEMEFEKELKVSINEASYIKTYGELVSMYEDNLID